jgi:hypothetical protein
MTINRILNQVFLRILSVLRNSYPRARLLRWVNLQLLGRAIRRTIHDTEKIKPVCATYGIKTYAEFNSQQYKMSDTLFVMGSGRSINTYSSDVWSEISTNDSFGFNLWLYQKLVPTYYMVEVPHGENASITFHNLAEIAAAYAEVPKFIKLCEGPIEAEFVFSKLSPEFRRNLYYVPLHRVDSQTPQEYDSLLEKILDQKVFRAAGNPSLQTFTRASLTQIICFALEARYKKIVLCGVDLSTPDVFFHSDDFKIDERFRPWPRDQQGPIHSTADPNVDPLTMDKVVESLNRHLVAPMGSQLFVAKRSSGLYPMLPAYFDEN